MTETGKQGGKLQPVRQWAGLVGVAALLAALVMQNLTYGPKALRLAVVGAGLLALIAAVALNWDLVWSKIRARATKAGAGSAAAAVLFLAILAGINYVSYRHPARADLTKEKAYTLSPQARKVLRNLKQTVKLTAYYAVSGQERAQYQQMRDLVDQYTRVSGRINLQVIDRYAKPFEVENAKAKGIRGFPCLVVEAGSNREIISSSEVNEQKLTSAILKVTQKTARKVYFLAGHGELDPDSYEQESGASYLKRVLLEDNYQVENLNLMEKKEVPADCTVLLVAGPRMTPTPEEQEALRKYLNAAGRVLLLEAPTPAPTWQDLFLTPFGIKVRDDWVIDPNNGQVTPVIKYEYHAITAPLQNNITLFPLPRSLELSREQSYEPGRQVSELVKSAAGSWGETNQYNLEYTEGKDTKGPLAIAAAATKELEEPAASAPDKKKEETPKKTMRVVVVGSAGAAANGWFPLAGNPDFFANSVNWLTESEDLIAIRPRSATPPPLYLTPSQAKRVKLVSLYLMPGILLLLGLGIWWARR